MKYSERRNDNNWYFWHGLCHLPLRIPYILRAGIIITLGISAWQSPPHCFVGVLLSKGCHYFIDGDQRFLLLGLAFWHPGVVDEQSRMARR